MQANTYFSKSQTDASLYSTKCRQMFHLQRLGKKKPHVEVHRTGGL